MNNDDHVRPEDCIHCVLAPHVRDFFATHPQKDGCDIVLEMAQMIGEVIAAGVLKNRIPYELGENLISNCEQVMRDTFEKHYLERVCSTPTKPS